MAYVIISCSQQKKFWLKIFVNSWHKTRHWGMLIESGLNYVCSRRAIRLFDECMKSIKEYSEKLRRLSPDLQRIIRNN